MGDDSTGSLQKLSDDRENLKEYEENGLVKARETENGTADYRESDLQNIVRVRFLIDAGMNLEEIRHFLELKEDRDAGYSVVKGEYLVWYSKNVTFENCRIIGTQPLCYCKNLRLINCEMFDTDLCFEKSEVEAVITTEVLSIKNPLPGCIYVPGVGEIIRDDVQSHGEIIIRKQCCCA